MATHHRYKQRAGGCQARERATAHLKAVGQTEICKAD